MRASSRSGDGCVTERKSATEYCSCARCRYTFTRTVSPTTANGTVYMRLEPFWSAIPSPGDDSSITSTSISDPGSGRASSVSGPSVSVSFSDASIEWISTIRTSSAEPSLTGLAFLRFGFLDCPPFPSLCRRFPCQLCWVPPNFFCSCCADAAGSEANFAKHLSPACRVGTDCRIESRIFVVDILMKKAGIPPSTHTCSLDKRQKGQFSCILL